MRMKFVSVLLLSLGFVVSAATAVFPVDQNRLPHEATALDARLSEAFAAKPASYEPRTEHFDADGSPTYINRLITETSPYLLQHAHNPVDWRPWGPEALAEARARDMPILLSIGYATCHWCHVMERESFENLAIAELINKHFVAIKVDREQRPDIDQIYMTAVQLTAGRGGWPLTAMLTVKGEPFFSGTYFPPENFRHLLEQVRDSWQNQRLDIRMHGSDVARTVKGYLLAIEQPASLTREAQEQAVANILTLLDPFSGGFSEAPKFPQEPMLALMTHMARAGGVQAQEALEAVTLTLDSIQRGGIHDQVAGGFHRYSTDNMWLVPHFEKMLYNQAQLGMLFLEAFELTGRLDYRRTVRRTLDYILREMRAPSKGFYSATDADNLSIHGEMEEGDFFIWSQSEVLALAKSETDKIRLIDLLNLSAEGNFEGRNILTLSEEASVEDLTFLEPYFARLYDLRQKRNPPLLDNKVIVSWNGLMIKTFASAALLLDDPAYAKAALEAGESLWQSNWDQAQSRLARIQFEGKAGPLPGQVDDYASLALGALSLYDLDGDSKWLDRASLLVKAMNEKFRAQDATYFMTTLEAADKDALMRPKDFYDGAQPSGNSMALAAMVALLERTGEPMLRKIVGETWQSLSGNALRQSASHATALKWGLSLSNHSLGSLAYASEGVVRLKAERVGAGEGLVKLQMKPGWHINSHKPLQEDYIGTSLTAEGLDEVSFPKSKLYRPKFSDEDLSVYEGEVEIMALFDPFCEVGAFSRVPTLDKTQNMPAKNMSIELQACNKELCLPPQSLTFLLPAFSG